MDCRAAQETGALAGARAISRLFVASFLASCLLFWWLLSFIYRLVLGVADPVTVSTLGMSALSAILFVAGFSLPRCKASESRISRSTLDGCERLSYRMTILLFPPVIVLAGIFAVSTIGHAYGTVEVTFAEQIVFYLHLFFGFLFLGLVQDGHQSKRRIWIAVVLIALPRFVASMNYGRMFLASGIVPLVLLAVARGFIPLSTKRTVQIAGLGLFIVFVPSIVRGDFSPPGGDAADAETSPIVNWFSGGSTLLVTQRYLDLDLSRRCPPLLVSLTGKVIPYTFLHVCTISLSGAGAATEQAANLDRVVTYEVNGSDGSMYDGGQGTSYLLELYVTGGLTGVVLGSFAFGAVCKLLTNAIVARSLFSGIWAECLMRAVFSPRGMLGYVFEKVPALLLLTMLVMLITREFRSQPLRP
jgi:hypothetical protein